LRCREGRRFRACHEIGDLGRRLNGVALRVRRALFVAYGTMNIAFRLLIAELNVIGLLTHGRWAVG
jgi:hypothetical protein